jgi:hypothetical protein
VLYYGSPCKQTSLVLHLLNQPAPVENARIHGLRRPLAGTGDPGRLSRDGLVTGATLTFPPRSISRARSTVLYLAALFRCTCKLLSDAYRPSLIVFAWSLRSANIHNRPPLPYLMFPPTGAYHYQTLTVTSFSLPRLFLPREPVGSSERTPPGTRRRWPSAGLHAPAN